MNPPRSRLDSVDVLRGFAAAAVVFYHVWNRYFPHLSSQHHALMFPAQPSVGYWMTLLIQFGYVGVTLFFVISGFCIHLPQARSFHSRGDDRFAIGPFARRRFQRLYPAYFASIVFTALMLGANPVISALLKRHVPDLIEMFALRDATINVLFLQPLVPNSLQFNGVYWTLIYEVQFYAFYPLLLWAVRRVGFKPMFVALLLAELRLLPDAANELNRPGLFVGRYFEWFLGMYVAEVYASGHAVRSKMMWASMIAGIVAGLASTLHPITWPLRDLLLSVGFAAMLLLVVNSESRQRQRGNSPWYGRSKLLLAFGASSYSLYLINVPIIDMFWLTGAIATSRHVISPSVAGMLELLSVPACFLLSYLFYTAFEEPFMSAKSRATTPPIPSFASMISPV